ncbi:amidohydrolase family protein [Kangiella sediminilitoris]|uniref:Amidohydrolase n=1 Tax=Kangiella sediminilitoris TaxID=1144748 RepID=A0A1B3BB68_9GAMM|nr:amidohydrolase family protein [Kangiella sediminilitoris]AOE50040.1 Amidohydrolase [Kangiella sediminilitoris]
MIKTLSKWLAGTFICILILISAYLIWFINGVNFIYGAHTEVVDHTAFATPVELTAITDVSVLSPDGQEMLPNRTVVVDGGEIISVTLDGMIPPNATVINGSGKYIIPGLVDSHAHILKSPNDLLLYVANGVTHIRDLGGPPERLKLREEIKQGRIGPRMFVTSPPIDSLGFLEGAFWEIITFHKNTNSVEHAKELVKEFAEQGYDAIKTYHLDMPSYHAVNQLADEIGIPTTGHLPLTLELSELAVTKQKEIAHLEEIVRVLIREFGSINEQGSEAFYAHVESRSDEIIDDLLANDITVNSVLWFMESIHDQFSNLDEALMGVPIEYANPGIVEGTKDSEEFKVGWLPGYNQFEAVSDPSEDIYIQNDMFWKAREKAHHILLKAMVRRGVNIVAGTDSGANLVVPGFSIHDELESLNKAGMNTTQAILSATAAPAELMNSNAGIIEVGRRADLVILNKNPLVDIENTRTIDTVILNGQVLKRERLDAMLEAVKESNSKSRKINIDKYLHLK